MAAFRANRFSSLCWRAAAPWLVAASALFSASAQADIWGYVDAQGLPHFAASKLDDRYELFLRDSEIVEPYKATEAPAREGTMFSGISGLAPIQSSSDAAVQSQPGPAAPLPRILTLFENSPDYKNVTRLLQEASQTHNIDYALLQALIATESGFNRHAVSPKGAVGLMQLILPTAQRYGVIAGKNATVEQKLTDPKVNISAGSRYLSDLLRMFPGQVELALAAYNAGEGAVQRAGNKIPNYPETKNYVKTVMQLYTVLQPAGAPKPLSSGSAIYTPGRVRVEIGGAAGRGNMPPPMARLPAATPAR
jgi:hypothetical protein